MNLERVSLLSYCGRSTYTGKGRDGFDSELQKVPQVFSSVRYFFEARETIVETEKKYGLGEEMNFFRLHLKAFRNFLIPDPFACIIENMGEEGLRR